MAGATTRPERILPRGLEPRLPQAGRDLCRDSKSLKLRDNETPTLLASSVIGYCSVAAYLAAPICGKIRIIGQ